MLKRIWEFFNIINKNYMMYSLKRSKKKYSNILIALAFIFAGTFLTSNTAYSQGVVFTDNLDEALAKAKVENKLVFIDFYTSWCGPCKVMSAQVFPLEQVGTFFNQNFINCKIQCDDNGVGVELGKKYQVVAYPTLMFLNKEGEIVHSAAGSLSPERLIQLAKDAMNPDRNLFSIFKSWENSSKDALSAKKYFKSLVDAYQRVKATQDFSFYFNTLSESEKLDENTFGLMQLVGISLNSPIFHYLEAHYDQYCSEIGLDIVNRFIFNVYFSHLNGLIFQKSNEEYKVALSNFKTKGYSFEDELVMYLGVYETLLDKSLDIKEYQKRGTLFLEKYGENSNSYALGLTSLLGNLTGRYNEGEAGIKWMEELLERNPNPRYLSTYFYILWRNGHWDHAIEFGEQIRANNVNNNISNTTIDKQIEECKLAKEKQTKRDGLIKDK